MDEPPDVLEVLQDVLATERAFYQLARVLDGEDRNLLLAAHMRNTTVSLSLLRLFMTQSPQATMVLTMDMSGNFFEPVPVAPTREEIAAGTETHRMVPANTTCAICQDDVVCATRIRACGHSFHGACIDQWLQLNPRCPVCRHDIRSLQPVARGSSNE